jgi:Histidine kinase-, DNA gyrase B-, and HSP90-like ATPase
MAKQPITVQTHVARDFLQNAAYFSSVPKVVWEYVSNSLDNAEESRPAEVVVEISGDLLRITDNGAGMSRKDLQNFFKMHGENVQRARGKRVRGRFGTGKCAAFGIANVLRVDSVKNGKRNVIELSRSDIESASTGEAFPVRDIAENESTDAQDGTVIEIRDFNIRKTDIEGTIGYVERHLARYRQRARVWINNHECKFQEPVFVEQFKFSPESRVANVIGDVELVIKISPIALDKEMKGIYVMSHGIWLETTLAGHDGKPQSEFIFGEVDVPILEDGTWPIGAFDNTRNNMLNWQNPAVLALMVWLSARIEEVRSILAERERVRRQSDQAQRLQKEAERIASILNDDFQKQQVELERARRVASRSGTASESELASDTGTILPGGGDEPSDWDRAGQPHGDGHRGDGPVGAGDSPRPGPSLIPGSEPGTKKQAVNSGQRKTRSGIFTIEYYNGTENSPRSTYDSSAKVIRINLDHPQIRSALGASGGTESRQFKEITYEVACVEYALALAYEEARAKSQFNLKQDAEDALYGVRETINRVSILLAKALG